MKTKFKGIVTLLLVLVVQLLFAQERAITGVVSDEMGPVTDITVKVKGTSKGTITDFDGNYTIKANVGDTLVFTHVSYETVEKKVNDANIINVLIKEEGNKLEEVVITALGIKRSKKSVGYATQSVKGEELNNVQEANIANAMAGKISGVQLVGAPGAGFKSAKIRLRGDSNVLYIVDNIKLRDLSSINTDDIEDMSVLKGLAATSLYGPEGQNGVVIITTKKAKNGEAKIIINSGVSLDKVTNLMETQNEYGGGYSQNWDTFNYNAAIHPASWAAFDGEKTPNYSADESWGPRLDGTLVRHWDSWIQGDPEFGKLRAWNSQPDNIKKFFKNGVTSRTSITALKGGEDYSVKVQLTHTNRESVMPNSDRITTQAGFNASYNVSNKLTVFGNFNYQDRKTNNELQENYGNVFSNINQWWQRQIDIDRVRNYRRNGQLVSWNINGPTDTSPKYWNSPFFDVYENTNYNDRNSLFGKIGGTYEFNDKLSTTVEVRKQFRVYTSYNQTGWGDVDGVPAYGEFNYTAGKDEYFAILNYDSKLSENIDLTANLGGEITNNSYTSNSARTSGGLTAEGYYSLDTSKDKPIISSYFSETKNKATFLKLSSGFKNLVFVDGSYRLDWGSTADIDLNVLHTRSLSTSLIFSKLVNVKALSFGKLRAGYSEAPSYPDPYNLFPTYEVAISYGSNGSLGIPDALKNKHLKAGTRKEFEIGTEMQFINNRIGIDLSYFKRNDEDLPVKLALDAATGNTSVFVNSGRTTSKGFEVSLDLAIVKNDKFRWNTIFNFATLKKEVIELAEGIDNNYLAAYSFRSNYWGNESMINMQERVGQEWGAIYGRRIKRNAEGKVFINPNGTYVTEENQYLGNHLPDFTGGFVNQFSYKNFDLSIGIDFQKGGKYFSMTEMFGKATGNHISTVGDNTLGNPVRDPLTDSTGAIVGAGVVLASNAGSNSGGRLVNGVDPATGNDVSYYVDLNADGWNKFAIGDEFLNDASYIKLRSIALNYNLTKRVLDKIKLKGVKIGFYANNLWLINSALEFVDPSEIESPNSTGNKGYSFIEGGQAPSSRSLGLNLQLTF